MELNAQLKFYLKANIFCHASHYISWLLRSEKANKNMKTREATVCVSSLKCIFGFTRAFAGLATVEITIFLEWKRFLWQSTPVIFLQRRMYTYSCTSSRIQSSYVLTNTSTGCARKNRTTEEVERICATRTRYKFSIASVE